MSLPKRYPFQTSEPELVRAWAGAGVYHFDPGHPGPVFSIDTPPPTVSGLLHLGHVYSYSHADFIARFRRMRGENVYYPMGFDDNGLPTERLVEKQLGATAQEMGRSGFIEACLQTSVQAEAEYQALWERLGLSIDWRFTYRTIDERSRRFSQWSFLDLHRQGLLYRAESPVIWCPHCRTAIAQAEVDDFERPTTFYTVAFELPGGESLPIATTRPELLPACVAVFVHPEDQRHRALAGTQALVPFAGHRVPVLADPGADPEVGTGVVMCCTFGDQADVAWWRLHDLPLRTVLGPDGRLTEAAGELAGLAVQEARQKVVERLNEAGALLGCRDASQTVRVHERCDTPVEYLVAPQWFVRLLEHKEDLLAAGRQVNWTPDHMFHRYSDWVSNLAWDWCISRQRAFGVPIPVWYCQACGEVILAEEDQLPVDPREEPPPGPCACGSTSFIPEADVLDTWATSSLSPLIAASLIQSLRSSSSGDGRGLSPARFSLRPQAHEIIRTWAFYTLAKSHFHFGEIPWHDALISGWGVAAPGEGKISKSRGGGPMPPLEMIEQYSADAVRYWAASTAPGKDAVISEEKIQAGARLVTKLWNVARFSQGFLEDAGAARDPGGGPPSGGPPPLSTADAWILSRLQKVVRRATELLEAYEYAAARSEVEAFFWAELSDNYLEMAKGRLYDPGKPFHSGARFALRHALRTILLLLAPFLPFVTERVYLELFTGAEGGRSVHRCRWPEPQPGFEDDGAEAAGDALVEAATRVRRYKSENSLSLGAGLRRLELAPGNPHLSNRLNDGLEDIRSVSRAAQVAVVSRLDPALQELPGEGDLAVGVAI